MVGKMTHKMQMTQKMPEQVPPWLQLGMAVFGFCIAADLIFFSCSYTLCTSIWNASSRVSKPKRKPKEFWSKSKRKRGEESTEGEPSVHAPEEEEFIATEWAGHEAADIPEFEPPSIDHVLTTDHVPTFNKFSATGSVPPPPPPPPQDTTMKNKRAKKTAVRERRFTRSNTVAPAANTRSKKKV